VSNFTRQDLRAYAARKSIDDVAWFPEHALDMIAARAKPGATDEQIAALVDQEIWSAQVPGAHRHDLARLCGYSDDWQRRGAHEARRAKLDADAAERNAKWQRDRDDPPELSPVARQIAQELEAYGVHCRPSRALDPDEERRHLAARDFQWEGDPEKTEEMVAKLAFLLDEHRDDKPDNFAKWFREKYPVVACTPWRLLPLGSQYAALLALFVRYRSRWPR
jgi:hypothetical protein